MRPWLSKLLWHLESIILFFFLASVFVCRADDFASRQSGTGRPVDSGHYVTNIAQFRTLSGRDYLNGCNFHLIGVITLVDTNRELVVLQDDSDAVALNFPLADQRLQVGQLVEIDGTNCCPFFQSFPNYPYRPSGWSICHSFETATNWGEYNLTRMRGCLHPRVTGDYTFWIASDNSSELWLSTNTEPSKARKIASVPRWDWVSPHEWSRYPSQRSEPIQLEAGESYYIEALQEQSSGEENLSVAWAGPGQLPSVINGQYLTPWDKDHRSSTTTINGILREYWTNYPDGDLSGMGGMRPFESALTVKQAGVRILGPGTLPKPDLIPLDQPLTDKNNYRWVQVEGQVRFVATDENTANLELSTGQSLVQVRVEHWNEEISNQYRRLSQLSNVIVRAQGVCEGVYEQDGKMMPGMIWASAENSVSFIKKTATNNVFPASQSVPSNIAAAPMRQGFYGTLGVVTFNDCVFGKDYLFVQQDNSAVLVSLADLAFRNQLKVGQGVNLGGALEPDKYLPIIKPLVITELGWHSMPPPIIHPLAISDPANSQGRWSELECVVHSVNTNGTLSVAGEDGPAYLWIGQTPSDRLAKYVDAKLRVRGVLMWNILDEPLLLVPSRRFLDVEEEAPQTPFGIPGSLIANVFSQATRSSMSHRVRVVGEITYRNNKSFFIQDRSGGIQVRSPAPLTVKTGNTVEVLAFPELSGSTCVLTGAKVRPAEVIEHVNSQKLNLNEAFSSRQSGALVHVSATLLACKTNGANQVLELQEQQRMFTATLATNQGYLPDIAQGSRLTITGICNYESAAAVTSDKTARAQQFPASLNILLRSPKDVIVLGGPPWWNWKRTVTLVGSLFTVLMITLLWVHLLHRRLERQQAAQLAFSRQVLERLEDERRRIAINLHDSLGQILLAIKNQALLAMQRPPDEPALRHVLDEISSASSQAIEEVRQITRGLRPYQLDRLGLTQAIRAVVSVAGESGSILFANRVENIDNAFDKESEIHVYRIVQEAVNNVVKHSAATEATVVIKRRPGVVLLSIRDNGRGFNAGTPDSSHPSGAGSGLNGIAERVRILNGIMTVDSKPGEGANLIIEVPLPSDNP